MGNGFVIAHILGAVQGVFLAVILASKRQGSVATRILAATMLVFALDLTSAVYHGTGTDAIWPHLIGLDYPLAFLYGPLLYLYAHALSNQARRFRRAYLWHFLPFLLLVLGLLPFYLQPGAAKLAFLHDAEPEWLAQVLGVINHGKLIHALLYVGLIFRLLHRHRRRIRDRYSDVDRINLAWLRNLLVGIVMLVGLAGVFHVLSLGRDAQVLGADPATLYDDYMLLATALFVYAIGLMGLRQPELWQATTVDDPGEAAPRVLAAPEAPAPQYAKSGMDPAEARRHKEALLALMEAEHLYRQGDLTLHDLSEALAISPHNLTEVINTQLGQNFYDFVNGYRVREVQARLADPAHDHLTLLAIGLEAGFNAKSSFNAVFKKHTQMTPSAYRMHVRQAS